MLRLFRVSSVPPAEVQAFLDYAAWVEDFSQLNALHLDEASGEYRDWGRHTGVRAPLALAGWAMGHGLACRL
jgi:hypothetical protein